MSERLKKLVSIAVVASLVATISAFTSESSACESSFVETMSSDSLTVYVLKFDSGAGFVRVAPGRIFMVDRDSSGRVASVEVFHDRGSGKYSPNDVFYPIQWPADSPLKYQWRKALGRNGFTPVQLIAAASDGVRFVGRSESGDLKLYKSSELFPLASSNR